MKNLTHKIKKILSLKGKTLEDSFYINLAKAFFVPKRLFTTNINLGYFLFKDVIAKNSYGYFFCRKNTGDLGIISESFEFEILKNFKPKKDNIVVDVGAHIGKYTVLASKLVGKKGKVIAIEPLKENFQILLTNLKLNNCTNVIPINVAIWNKNTTIQLFLHNDKAHSSLIHRSQTYKNIKAYRLDTLLKHLNIKHIDWLKVDAEGAELQVLQGLKKIKVKNLIIESSASTTIQILSTLALNNFHPKTFTTPYPSYCYLIF